VGSVDQTKSRIVGRGHDELAARGSAYLLVVENDSSRIFHLPHCGVVVIGRGNEVELRLDHASVSRRHATIRVDDGLVRIADLGSHNGTRVNGEAIGETRVLASGDVATVGDVVCVVHFSQPAPPARPSYAESGWRRRLAEELERAMTYRRELAVIAVLAPDLVAATLAPALRMIDVIGNVDEGQLLLLLPESDRELARSIAMRVLECVPTARLGLAVCPVDACDSDTMLLAARAAARRTAPGTIGEPADAATRIELGSRHVWIADPAMIRMFAHLERLASSELNVLISGETGVGKENAAYAVHHWSRRSGPFIAVNCAALGPESLVDSELFGHDKGAFTGAASVKVGLFESAAGGTLFLDEVGELPAGIQAKLLRALEVRKITRLGESRERAIDVRLVAATNRSLEVEAAEGRFRRDLYFRLGGATVILPPLRDRRCEIPLLALRFLDDACRRAGREPMTITPDTMQVLLTHTWPGNVRELKNTIEYVVAAAPDERVEPGDLPERLGGAGGGIGGPSPLPMVDMEPTAVFRPISEELRDLERRRMAEALVAAGGVKTRAASLIEMPIRTFTLKLKQYRL
jgi:two-component system response regulator AtoC